METKIQELERRIVQLEEMFARGDFQSEKQFDSRVVFKNGIIVENGRILIRSKNNPEGIYIVTGAARNATDIVAEQGALPNGSIYSVTDTPGLPFFVKYGGTWTALNLP